ncbi:MAG: DUF5688 family protein [Eubacteriales bacterium]|jgi:hypothetical protein|nr:DUF5688 family protein [Lachnospiraceae bacterium]MCI1454173.1 DUF5688 family protein [Lachnospiraceae bacterium]MDD5860628.1 DUF5688 family protein [Eubacteriales bacterium]
MQQTYEQFRSDLADSIRSIPGEKKNVSVRRVPKLNGVSYYGLTILGEGESVSPAIYLEPYYEMYRAGMSLDTVAGLVMKERESHRVLPVPVETLTAFSEVRDRIRYRVINYEMNKEFLQDIPFRRVLDLAVVLYYTVDLRLSETATIFVRCDTVRRWGVSEEDLFSLAESATPVADPPCVCPLTKLLVELGLEEEIWDEPGDVPLWIITNDRRTFGSACMFYPKVLAETAAFIGADLFILPSSIHEVLAMPNNGTLSREELELMVRQINVTQVKRTEVLSDHVYSYRRGERALTLL